LSDQRQTPLGIAVALLFGFVVLIGISEFGARVLFPQWNEFFSGHFMQVTPVPKHVDVLTGRPGFDGYFAQNNGDFRVRIQINDSGLRNIDPIAAADGALWVIGDSMAFGWGVEQSEIYSSVIASVRSTPVYNVASPGSDVCGYQALAGRMPKQVKPKAVILGLILENDVHHYNCKTRASQTKTPESALPNSSLSLVEVKEMLTNHSALYNFVSSSLKKVGPIVSVLKAIGLIKQEHAYKLTFDEKQLDKLVESTALEIARLKDMFRPDLPFAVLIAPARFEIRDNDPLFRRLREGMVKSLQARDISIIDPIEAFLKAGFQPTHFAHDGHWTPLGHVIAGNAVGKWLAQTQVPQ
jgi:hypothetical protein